MKSVRYFCPKLGKAQGDPRHGRQLSRSEIAPIEQPVATGDGTQQRRRSKNKRLRQAVYRHKPISKRGIQERLFTLAFSGLCSSTDLGRPARGFGSFVA